MFIIHFPSDQGFHQAHILCPDRFTHGFTHAQQLFRYVILLRGEVGRFRVGVGTGCCAFRFEARFFDRARRTARCRRLNFVPRTSRAIV